MTLEEHDRSLYDAALAAEADELVRGTLAPGARARMRCRRRSPSLHSLAPSYAETDWEQIAALYGAARALDPSPVVALNRAVAVSFAEIPRRRCRCSRRSRRSSTTTRRSMRRGADVQRRHGAAEAARAAYERAIELTDNPGERAFLARRLRRAGRGLLGCR